MAHFAQLDENNVVVQVIVVNNNELIDENGNESESKGIKFCQDLFGGNWIQTSYNGTFRRRYAGVGFTYNSELDAFIPIKRYSSWILNSETADWMPPIPQPSDNMCIWNEETQSWAEYNPSTN